MQKAMTLRIVDMVYERSPEILVKWLDLILGVEGGYAKLETETILFRNESINFGGGFAFNSDPVTKAVMIASAIVGAERWMWVFPELLIEVNKKWSLKK